MKFSAQQIADFLKGSIEGDPTISVSSFSKIDDGKPGTLSFLSNHKYMNYIYDCDASIILVNKDFIPERPVKATLIRVEDAYGSLAHLLNFAEQQKSRKTGISSLASIERTAVIGKDAYIAPLVQIGENVIIGKKATIHGNVTIAENVTIGDNVTLFPGVCIYNETTIGNDCIIHSNTVIGSDGFGFAREEDGSYSKILQLGNVIIEDQVEIGSNSSVDRATFGSTVIAKEVKLDNLVQVAHNVEIGENSVIASQSGIAGSSKIGKGCMFGGQVAISGHLNIADRTTIGGKAGVGGSIKIPDQTYSGYPAVPINIFRRAYVVNKNLPELQKTVNLLQQKIEALEKMLLSDNKNA